MSGFRLILLESSVRGETFFEKVNFKRADWSEPVFFFPIIRHSQNELEPEQRLYLRDYCLREITVSTQNAPQTNCQEYGALASGISDEIGRRVKVPKVMILQELSS
jgi:hypothetical protein